jgi:hypothetical protein
MTPSTPLRQPSGDKRGVARASKFLSFEEDGGAFHWAITVASGDRLVPSATSASYVRATQAAGVVRPGAVSAPFDKHADDPVPSSSPPAGRGRPPQTT